MKNLFLIFLIISINLLNANDFKINIKSLQIKSLSLVNKGMYDEALILIDKSLINYPKNDYLISLKAKCFQEKNNLDEAEIYFQKALSINPNNEFALMYIEKTKKTKILLKNDTQESMYDFLKDKGIDLLFIFLGFLAGEMIANFLLQCNANNWKLIIYRLEFGNNHSYAILYPRNIIRTIKKYIFDSICPFKIIFSFITFLIIIILFVISMEIIFKSSSIEALISPYLFWQHILKIFIYASIFLSIIWIIKLTTKYQTPSALKIILIETLHNMYKNQDIIELHKLMTEIYNVWDRRDLIENLQIYIINKEELEYFENFRVR